MTIQKSIFEWSAIGFTFASVGMLAFGICSQFFTFADFELLPSPMTLEFRSLDAKFVFSDCLGNQDLVDAWCSPGGGPPILSDMHLPIPGFEMRYTVFASDYRAWYLRVSCWLVLVVCIALSAICWRRYLRLFAASHVGRK